MLPATNDIPPSTVPTQVEQRQTPDQPDANQSLQTASLQARLEQIVKDNESQGVTTSISLYNLESGRLLYGHDTSTSQFAASVNKLPIALLLLEDLRNNSILLSDTVTWQVDDIRPGLGIYDQPNAPLNATVQDLLFDMLNHSGNTAVRALVNYKLSGPQAVNDRLARMPGIVTTRLTVLGPTSFYLGNSTSQESVLILQKLIETEDSYQAFIKNALVTNIFSYYGVRSQLEGNDYIVLANKVGILDDPDGNNRHDVGIIYNTRNGKSYGYSFMTTAASGNINGTAAAEHSLDLLGRQTLRFAGDKPGKAPKSDLNGRAAMPEKRVRY